MPDDRRDAGIDPDRLAALVRECIAMMQAGGIARLELKYGELELLLRAHDPPGASQGVVHQATSTQKLLTDLQATAVEGHVITAPMIGTFYHASAPGEPPFVAPGDRVEEGQTIGIIEAMKIMNEIAADRAGVVEEIVAANGQTVEYGSALIRLAPNAG